MVCRLGSDQTFGGHVAGAKAHTDTGFSGLQVLRCVVINFDSVLKTVLNQCHLQVIFIHVLIKFYAVLEECMPVEENLRKILMMLEEQ